jgi:hypothetical protein
VSKKRSKKSELKAAADRIIAATEPDAVIATELEVLDVAPVEADDQTAPVETAEPESAATVAPETETTTEPTAEQLDAIAAAEAKIESLKADLAKARVELSAFKKGAKGDVVDAEGKPLTAGKKAWLTRLARGFEPKPKAPKAPRDPNAPLTAGQKAAATRVARKADPNYQPPEKVAKVPAAERLDAAIGAAFPADVPGFYPKPSASAAPVAA